MLFKIKSKVCINKKSTSDLLLMRLLVLHGFADGFVVRLIGGEVQLHAGV